MVPLSEKKEKDCKTRDAAAAFRGDCVTNGCAAHRVYGVSPTTARTNTEWGKNGREGCVAHPATPPPPKKTLRGEFPPSAFRSGHERKNRFPTPEREGSTQLHGAWERCLHPLSIPMPQNTHPAAMSIEGRKTIET